MRKDYRKILFIVWGWLAIPWFLGSLVVAFSVNLYLGIGLALIIALWFYDKGETTCSRCTSYGTGRCGVQSWIVPLIWNKGTIRSASRLRVRLHYYYDLLMMLVALVIFAFVPIVLPFYIAWMVLGWFVVYGPKQHHGLTPLLRITPQQKIPGRISLVVLPTTANKLDICSKV